MSLARVKVWNPGDVLTASDLNSEFNNVLNNPVSLISPSTGAINFNLQSHTGLLPSAITASSGSVGQVFAVTSSSTVPVFLSAIPVESRVRGLLGAVSSQTGTFSAEGYIQRSTDGLRAWSVTATSSFSASVGTAGPAAGGRDIAGSFASTYVHWYAITTGPLSTAPAALVSTNPPSVGPAALPTGYFGWTYLNASLYSSSSTTCPNAHHVRGSWVTHDSAVAVVTGGTSTSETTIATAAVVPTNSLALGLNAELGIATNAGGAAQATLQLRFVTGSNAAGCKVQTENASNSAFNSINPTLPSTALAYVVDSQVSSANINTLSALVQVRSYQVPNGGE